MLGDCCDRPKIDRYRFVLMGFLNVRLPPKSGHAQRQH